MRRLYSTFATGLPGLGLLLMRVVIGVTLIYRSVTGLSDDAAMAPAVLLVCQIALGVCLVAGLWTPVAGALVGLLKLVHALVPASVVVMYRGDPWMQVLLATLGVALALLGPGAWSIDARLFGWKRIDLGDRQNRPPTAC